jgi:cell division protein FtsN
MKEKTFYTINLDMTRIIVIIALFFLILGYVYMLGRKNPTPTVSEPPQNNSSEKVPIKDDKGPNPNLTSKTEEPGSDVIDLSTKENLDETDLLTTPNEVEDVKPEEVKKKKSRKAVRKRKETPTISSTAPVEVLYTIQLGAFSSLEKATRFKNQVMANNKELATIPYIEQKDGLFLVRLGSSSSREELKKIIDSLDDSLSSIARIKRKSAE